MLRKLSLILVCVMILLLSGCESIAENDWKTIIWGSYEQDNDLTNGKEPIEWLILSLDDEDGTALLLSKYALDVKPYNEKHEDVTWNTCSLRAWLNNEFYNEAFDDEEKKSVITTNKYKNTFKNMDKTVNADNEFYETKGGSPTVDNVFLLSISEATNEIYGFKTDKKALDVNRRCVLTKYAVSKKAYQSSRNDDDFIAKEEEGTCWWWLRSPGFNSCEAASVDHWGYVYDLGDRVHDKRLAIRPAIYLDMNKFIRNGAGLSYDLLTDKNGIPVQLDSESQIKILAEEKNAHGKTWYNVELNQDGVSYTGYVSDLYVKKGDEEINSLPQSGKIVITVAN